MEQNNQGQRPWSEILDNIRLLDKPSEDRLEDQSDSKHQGQRPWSNILDNIKILDSIKTFECWAKKLTLGRHNLPKTLDNNRLLDIIRLLNKPGIVNKHRLLDNVELLNSIKRVAGIKHI